MTRSLFSAFLATLLAAGSLHAAEVKTTLDGSRASMQRQNRVARELEYSFMRTDAQVTKLAEQGHIVPVPGGEDYTVLASWPYARPVVREFVERLAAGYRAGCGERLVVTSLTRPARKQPGNASPLSVHPAGMAVDLRVSGDAGCVGWLQAELLDLESRGVIDATREYRPPHFHVAVFPEAYARHAAQLVADSAAGAERERAERMRQAELAALRAALPPMPTLTAAAPVAPVSRLLVALLSLARFMLPW